MRDAELAAEVAGAFRTRLSPWRLASSIGDEYDLSRATRGDRFGQRPSAAPAPIPVKIEPPAAQFENLPEAWQEPVRRLAARVRECLGAEALGLVVHGAALDRIDAAARLRSVLVLRQVNLAALRLLAADGPRFARLGLAAPVVLTPESIERSRDTFPLELLDIARRRVVALGQDFFAGLQFEREHVRLACERELKVILLAMSQGLLSSAALDARLGELSHEMTLSLARVLCGLLWLADRPAPPRVFALVSEVERVAGFPLPGVLRALDRSEDAGWNTFLQLYADLEALGQFADGL